MSDAGWLRDVIRDVRKEYSELPSWARRQSPVSDPQSDQPSAGKQASRHDVKEEGEGKKHT